MGVWPVTPREKNGLRTFEIRVLRKILGPKRDEVAEESRRLHNEEFHDLNASPNIIRVIKSRRVRRAGHVTRMGDRRGAYRFLMGRPDGKRPLGKPRPRGEDNIKMDLQDVGWREALTGLFWIRMGKGVGAYECSNEPSGSIKCGELLT